MRKEKGMVILVGCILLSYLVAYLPVSIVRAYQLDYVSDIVSISFISVTVSVSTIWTL